jgi:hypothetical protein
MNDAQVNNHGGAGTLGLTPKLGGLKQLIELAHCRRRRQLVN